VATSQPLATQAGIVMLQRGQRRGRGAGNGGAADRRRAVQRLGSDLFAIVSDGAELSTQRFGDAPEA
jgi:hypothetical protein